MRVLVTVGTTRFDSLIKTVTSDEFIARATGEKLITRMTLQHGNYPLGDHIVSQSSLSIDAHPFIVELAKRVADYDVVIGHCGSGTVLDVLRGPVFSRHQELRPKLILVPNAALMDRHQDELAEEMERLGAALIAQPTTESLIAALRKAHQIQLEPLPKPNTQILDSIISSYIPG